MTFNPVFDLGDFLSVVGIAVALATFLYQSAKGNELRRTEIYQGMEFASNDLFGFEAEHNKTLERFRDMAPVQAKFTDLEWQVLNRYAEIEEKGAAVIDSSPAFLAAWRKIEEDTRIVRKYYEKTLNMFEVSTRFRKQGIVEDAVFGSWVIWYYDTCQEWAFRWLWPKLRKNYVEDLRSVFDFPTTYFAFEGPNAEDEDTLEHDFFVHVARVMRCKVVAEWLSVAETDVAKLREQAMRHGTARYPSWPSKYGAAPKFLALRKAPSAREISAGFPGGDEPPAMPANGAQ